MAREPGLLRQIPPTRRSPLGPRGDPPSNLCWKAGPQTSTSDPAPKAAASSTARKLSSIRAPGPASSEAQEPSSPAQGRDLQSGGTGCPRQVSRSGLAHPVTPEADRNVALPGATLNGLFRVPPPGDSRLVEGEPLETRPADLHAGSSGTSTQWRSEEESIASSANWTPRTASLRSQGKGSSSTTWRKKSSH